jgi:hypothetical protein
MGQDSLTAAQGMPALIRVIGAGAVACLAHGGWFLPAPQWCLGAGL